jgi:hypothetical protein
MADQRRYPDSALQGRELEDFGNQLFSEMGLKCVGHLSDNVRLRDINPRGAYSPNTNTELDYLVAHRVSSQRSLCLVGEITGRSDSRDVERKFERFRRAFDAVREAGISPPLLRTLGVPTEETRYFRNVADIYGFFVARGLERFDTNLSPPEKIAVFYKADWERLQDYRQCITTHALTPFLDAFGFPFRLHAHPYQFEASEITNRKIVSHVDHDATVYSFHASPYDLLNLCRIFRRDSLPDLSP